jgi:hypothetical protein
MRRHSDRIRCRSCDDDFPRELPTWHPRRLRGATMRPLVLRVWHNRHLRVCSVEDVLCRDCADHYGRVQGRAA